MQYPNNQRVRAKIAIAKLILQESGTYNPMFSRPYDTNVDSDSISRIVRRVEERPGVKITGSTFAGAASNIVQPTATPGAEIVIPYQWSERRIRFLMEVHVTLATGAEMIQYFQGYTSYLGVSAGGHIDRNMDFILNSYVSVNRQWVNGPHGRVAQDVIVDTAHIVNGAIHQQSPNGSYAMRPQDIFTGIQTNFNDAALSSINAGGQLHDFRSKLNGESVMSKRSNNISGAYLAGIVDTYQTGKQMSAFGADEMDIHSRCYDLVRERTPFENEFIRAISNVRGTHTSTVFNTSDLFAIDPNYENVTDYITLGNTVNTGLHSVGQTSYWNGSDRETLAATILSNAVPALMMDLFINKIYFRTTNHTFGAATNTILIDAQSLSNADMSVNYEIFKRRLEQEILFDVSGANSTSYVLEMQSNLFGDTRISISLDGGPMIEYVTPSFCDSLLTPVIALNKDNYHHVVHDMETLFNYLPDGSSYVGLNTNV